MDINITDVLLNGTVACPECEDGTVLVGPTGTMKTRTVCPRCNGSRHIGVAVRVGELVNSVVAAMVQVQQETSAQVPHFVTTTFPAAEEPQAE